MKKINYKILYKDLIKDKYPEKKNICESILKKNILTIFDIIELNKKLFGDNNIKENQKFRSYTKEDILNILDYQKKFKLNNVQLAKHFKLSRNSIAKWKKLYL
ncbi:helix-turn-helix domain-containing protein [Empedobacter falsenii]|uniref:helix-turn-helix domain-containing protein n=1 Tax=Empedobacter falsenii TaxID=343874 RepID=UPI002575238A|nr:helix-turn-helix domain-containing protein [Empedobacter falsenii]MDM1549539.1 helix-turn-helix domain-containing protein [Empedobacter falsenii]